MATERKPYVDARLQAIVCPKCNDVIPVPLGAIVWVLGVMDAFCKAHRNCNGISGKTWFGKLKDGAQEGESDG